MLFCTDQKLLEKKTPSHIDELALLIAIETLKFHCNASVLFLGSTNHFKNFKNHKTWKYLRMILSL